jgi:hypothetical protein
MTGTASITNNGKIYGGAGGTGVNYSSTAQHGTAGNGGDAIGYGGAGGLGGGGVGGPGGAGGGIKGLATTIINTGLLQGGNGGAPAPGSTTDGGIGGVGIRGSNLTIVIPARLPAVLTAIPARCNPMPSSSPAASTAWSCNPAG